MEVLAAVLVGITPAGGMLDSSGQGAQPPLLIQVLTSLVRLSPNAADSCSYYEMGTHINQSAHVGSIKQRHPVNRNKFADPLTGSQTDCKDTPHYCGGLTKMAAIARVKKCGKQWVSKRNLSEGRWAL